MSQADQKTRYTHSTVILEGTLDLRRVPYIRPPECNQNCNVIYLPQLCGIAYTDTGASNIANIERHLELLNGKDVKVTIEWNDVSQIAGEGQNT